MQEQRRRYSRARQVKWPGGKIHRPAYCFASVIVRTENKNVTISDRFICFILTVKQLAALAACVLRATTKNFFWEKSARPTENPGYAPDLGWPDLRIFWPRNDLAPLLLWRRHCARVVGGGCERCCGCFTSLWSSVTTAAKISKLCWSHWSTFSTGNTTSLFHRTPTGEVRHFPAFYFLPAKYFNTGVLYRPLN